MERKLKNYLLKGKLFIYFLIILFLESCNKNKNGIDKVISGYFYNTATNLPLSNIEVQFIEIKEKKGLFDKSSFHTLTSFTDENGNFTFETKIYYESRYYYKIIVPYKYYDDFEFRGFEILIDDKSVLDKKINLGSSYSAKGIYFKLPDNIEINSPDSFVMNLHQNLFIQNEPEFYSFNGWKNKLDNTSYLGTIEYCNRSLNIIMGLWDIKFMKWKNGIYSETIDSIYLEKGEAKIYELPW